MYLRLLAYGVDHGTRSAFWRDVPEALVVPRVGDLVDLGVQAGANPRLDERAVVAVRWAPTMDSVEVVLDDLFEGWLLANRGAFLGAGWVVAMAGLA